MLSLSKRLLPLALLVAGVASCTAQDPPIDAPRTTDRSARRASVNDDITNSRRNAITRAVEIASPAIVGINVTEIRAYTDPFHDFFNDPFFERYFVLRSPRSFQREVHGLGSGFIISPDGYIVTNDHVAGNATKVVVTMTDGKQYEAKIIGSDPVSDVALLKIDASDLPYVRFASSDEVIVGEWVIALGNPFGLFDINSKPTVTVGVVSNTQVNLRPQENRVYRGMIQTDAAISSGNSGGPLLNANGEVIGMNTVIYSTSQSQMGAGSIGIGFAVPVARVRRIVEEIRRNGSIDRNYWTGMRIQQVDENLARYLRLSTRTGVVVVDIAAGSPAEEAGLMVGDVIVGVNSEKVRTEDDAVMLLSDARVGDVLTLRVLRDGKELERKMKLERSPR